MKKYSKIYISGSVIILLFTGLICMQLSRTVQKIDFLSDSFYSMDTKLSIERIHNVVFTEMNVPNEIQNEIKALLKGLELKETKNTFTPLNTDYKVASKSNVEDQLYLFWEENIIVFPSKSSKGYKIKNNLDLMSIFSKLQEE